MKTLAPSSRKPAAKSRAKRRLEDLPNIGSSVAGDLRLIGIGTPDELTGRDPYLLYEEVCRVTGQRHDPCLLDTFIAVTRHLGGEEARPWWHYTAERKRELARRRKT